MQDVRTGSRKCSDDDGDPVRFRTRRCAGAWKEKEIETEPKGEGRECRFGARKSGGWGSEVGGDEKEQEGAEDHDPLFRWLKSNRATPSGPRFSDLGDVGPGASSSGAPL